MISEASVQHSLQIPWIFLEQKTLDGTGLTADSDWNNLQVQRTNDRHHRRH